MIGAVDPGVVVIVELIRSQLAEVHHRLTEHIVRPVRLILEKEAADGHLAKVGEERVVASSFTVSVVEVVATMPKPAFSLGVEELGYLESLVASLETLLAKFVERPVVDAE